MYAALLKFEQMPSVMRVRWAKFRVASVSIVALIILSVLAYLLTGGTLLEQKSKIFVYIPDATGLGPGSPVRVDGIDIGTVDSVNFSGSNEPTRIIRVQMTVQKSRLDSITMDSITQISNDTIVGDKFVDISTGTAPGHVQPNGELRFRPQPDLMRSVDLTQFEQQLRIVDATLAEIEQGRSQLGKFIIGEDVYLSLLRRLTGLRNGLRKAMATNSELGSLLNSDAMYQKVRAPITKLDQQIAFIQSGQGGLGQFLRDPAQFEQLRGTLLDLQKSIASVRSADFIASDASYTSWTKTLGSITQQVDELNQSRLLNTTDLYEQLSGSMKQMQSTVKDFRQNPSKYLRVKVF